MASQDDLVTATKNLVVATNNLGQILRQVLPYIQSTSATANSGAGIVVPNKVHSFLVITEPGTGTIVKIPTFEV